MSFRNICTDPTIGYVIADVDKEYDVSLLEDLQNVSNTIRCCGFCTKFSPQNSLFKTHYSKLRTQLYFFMLHYCYSKKIRTTHRRIAGTHAECGMNFGKSGGKLKATAYNFRTLNFYSYATTIFQNMSPTALLTWASLAKMSLPEERASSARPWKLLNV